MGGCLVGHHVESLAAAHELGLDLGSVADQGDGERLPAFGGRPGPGQRLIGRLGEAVHVAHVEAPAGPVRVDLDADGHALVHRHGQRLGATHAAEAGRQGHPPPQRAAEVLASQLGERLVRALEDALRGDVDPRPGGHLAVHRQALPLELAEDVPGGPLAHQVAVGDEHAGRPLVGPEDADRLARLDQQRLVIGQAPQFADDGVEGCPAPRRPAGPAVDDEIVGPLGDLRVQVVHEHAQGGFLLPPPTGQGGAAWGSDGTGAGAHSSRRMTGKRASATATVNPSASQNPGVAPLCWSAPRVRSG